MRRRSEGGGDILLRERLTSSVEQLVSCLPVLT